MPTDIHTVNELVNTLTSLPEITPEKQRKLDEKFRLEFSYNSNHIEGNTLTYGETQLLLVFDKTEGMHQMREYEEMKAHDVAYKLIQEMASDTEFRLTEMFIKDLNTIILKAPFWKDAVTADGQPTQRRIEVGQYKKFPNSVKLANGAIFEYATPIDTPVKMGELIEWYHTELAKKVLHPVELAALLHYKFVCIHPFDDGNGRIARLLLNYVLLNNNLPPIIIKSTDKKDYLHTLNQADTGNIEAFIKYITAQLIWSLQTQIKAAKGESIEEPDDIDKKIALLKKDLTNPKIKKLTQDWILEMYATWIKDLIEALITAIQKFNIFFESALHNITFMGGLASSGFTNELPNEITEKLEEKLKTEKKNWSSNQNIEIGAQYGSLKSTGLPTFNCNYYVTIQFTNNNIYKIFVDIFDESAYNNRKEKLLFTYPLYRSLTPTEIQEIKAEFANAIFQNIEYNTKKYKLR